MNSSPDISTFYLRPEREVFKILELLPYYLVGFTHFFFLISVTLDGESQYLDRLETKIRRASTSTSDAEDISEQMDVSAYIFSKAS